MKMQRRWVTGTAALLLAVGLLGLPREGAAFPIARSLPQGLDRSPRYVLRASRRPAFAAYALLQELRLAACGAAWARAQPATLRLELLKIGVQVIASVRRPVLRLPAAIPYRAGWRTIALQSGARRG